MSRAVHSSVRSPRSRDTIARPRRGPLGRQLRARPRLGRKELARPSARCVGRHYGSCRGRSDAKLTAGRAWWVVRLEKALSRRRGRVGAAPIGGANRARLSVRHAGRPAMAPRGERAAQLTARRAGWACKADAKTTSLCDQALTCRFTRPPHGAPRRQERRSAGRGTQPRARGGAS